MAEKLDIILFGVTGFTGKHTVKYLHKFASAKGRHLTWAVAGRNETKIHTILDNVVNETNDKTLSKIPIILADVLDANSIQLMVSKARLIINCCGPYRFFGEIVVEACVEAGTHHVDVSGEPYFMETMELKYHDKAKEKGIYIVSACGFESIPSDLGAVFLQNNFEGTLHSIETYLKLDSIDGSSHIPRMNYGTWESAVHEVGHVKKLKSLRSQLFPNRLPKLKPILGKRWIPFKSSVDKNWAVFFPASDRSVMERTQRFFYQEKNRRPIQIYTYLLVKNFVNIILLGLTGLIFTILARFKLGLNLLLKYPSLFSFGFFDSEGPSEENIQNTRFCLTLFGKGWRENLVDSEHEYQTPPNKGALVQVEGRNPVYGVTCKSVVLAAIVILTETSKMPNRGGVYSPGAAFAATSLVEQLNENGVNFEFLKDFEL
ncbi:hypothetical protein HHI36_001294 [Cryptolaemus montrouzieri]|uniref:Saccharopine dehydrogenase NADP binding domain-containing protein n=1 Tax=Cryptolaemus montrouzieri TaxID=559131 RepID=A0ABD2P770_9CUCU